MASLSTVKFQYFKPSAIYRLLPGYFLVVDWETPPAISWKIDYSPPPLKFVVPPPNKRLRNLIPKSTEISYVT